MLKKMREEIDQWVSKNATLISFVSISTNKPEALLPW